MPQRILGLDIGAWSIKGVVIENHFRGFRVIDAQEVRIEPGEEETRQERQLAAMQQLLEQESTRVDVFSACLAGETAAMRFVPLPYADTKKVEATIEGELADTLPFDIDDSVYDHTIVQKTPDGGSLTFAAAVPHLQVADALALLEDGGVDPKFLSVDVAQLFNLYTHFLSEDQSKPEEPTKVSADAGTFITHHPGGPPPARLLVDVGHERTLIAACGDDGVAHVRVIRHGGRDVTEALAKAFSLDHDDAEALKHSDGFVASNRQPPPTEEAQRVSDAIREGLVPLVRSLRRTLLSIRSEKRVRIARMDLLGGGSKIRNFANYLAEELNLPAAQGLAVEQNVERNVDASRRPAYALALALALRGSGEAAVSPIDLRRGAFSFSGGLQHLRTRLPFIGVAAAVLFVLGVANIWVAYYTIGGREDAVSEQFCKITKQTVGREICEPKVAISVMAQPVGALGNVSFPERSALNIAAELSARIPKDVAEKEAFKIEELDITPDRARISGETDAFDSVDKMVGEYAKDPCYSNIKKGKLRRKSDGKGIEFQITMRLECSS